MASTEGYLGNRGDQRSSDEIRRSIERQRDDLDVTTEVLQRKLAPRELAEQLWTDMRTRVSSGAGDVVGVVKRHPVPLGLIGAGIAWWIYETSSGRGLSFGNGGGEYDEDELGVGSMSTGSYGSASSFSGSEDSSTEESQSEGAYVSGAENWRQRSIQAAQRSGERLRSGALYAREGFSNAIDRNPLALGAACFSLGLLAAIAVPASRWENATLGETRDRVTRKARRVAKRAAVGAAEQGARAAQEAAERIKDEAERSPSQYAKQRQGTGADEWRGTSSTTPGTSGGYRGTSGTGSSSMGSYGTPSPGTGSSSTGSYGTGSSSTGTGTSRTGSSTGSTSGAKPNEPGRTGGSVTSSGKSGSSRSGSEDRSDTPDPWDPDRAGRG